MEKKHDHIPLLPKESKSKRALVFGGGGARGAYQIGVWKALKELGIDFQLITGTSVGALNGALVLQDEYDKAENMWKKIETGNVLEIKETIAIDSFRSFWITVNRLAATAIRKKGISAEPLKQLIHQFLPNEDLIRNKGIEFGITLTEYPSMKYVAVFLEDIPYGQLGLYLLGSASFYPAMAVTKIGGKMYIDGGYHDNLPIGMAVQRGASEIISVDVRGPGTVKTVKLDSEIKLRELKSRWSLGNMLLFDGNRAIINIDLGYFETLKSYGIYEGTWYTFEKESFAEHYERFYQLLAKFVQYEEYAFLAPLFGDHHLQRKFLERLRKNWGGRVGKKEFSYAIHELTGKLFQIDPTSIYTFESFNKLLFERYEELANITTIDEYNNLFQADIIYTMDEWIDRYMDQIPLFSNKKTLIYFLKQLEDTPERLFEDWKVLFLINQKPLAFLMALCIFTVKKETH